jgi:hypothetical protein
MFDVAFYRREKKWKRNLKANPSQPAPDPNPNRSPAGTPRKPKSNSSFTTVEGEASPLPFFAFPASSLALLKVISP